jgi:uncharacterized protein (DUF1684 family)
MKIILLSFFVLLFSTQQSHCQATYNATIKKFQANYVASHEVVTAKDKKYFRFYGVDSRYTVKAGFEKILDTIGFTMKTSGAITQHYYKYGKLSFSVRDTMLHLYIYQSKDLMNNAQYKDYLFIPFTDLTTGDETYGSGRYLDFRMNDIQNNELMIDFNKSYNPYCAYATGYHCPVPPKENFLPIGIKAGEKVFGKAHM